MFSVKLNGPNRVDIELDGKLDSDAMKVALDELVEVTSGIENGRMLYRVKDFQLPTLGAMAIEFFRLPSMFGLIGRFDRAAVVADQSWIQRISELEGALIPGLQIKAFGRNQEAEAEAWLAAG
jgi:hypothetical protein